MADPIEEVARTNGLNPDQVKDFVGRVEALQSDIDRIMDAAKNECAPLREDIGHVKKAANDVGLSRKPLNTCISVRRKLRNATKQIRNLDEGQLEDYGQMEEALGDFGATELGFAALERVRPE